MWGTLPKELARLLRDSKGSDGGFGPRVGAPSEPEPTALAAIALDDPDARSWLAVHQRSDGSVAMVLGNVTNDSATSLASIALGVGAARERALDHLISTHARSIAVSPDVPLDPSVPGWGWTEDAAGWVEPTSRNLLALRLHRPTAAASIEGGAGMLRSRECSGGGWNYGNPVVFGEHLPPFAQTTAMALIGLQGSDPALEARGLARLRALWREEVDGTLTLATAAAALGLHGDADAQQARSALERSFATGRSLGDNVTLSWAVIATGPGLDLMRVGA